MRNFPHKTITRALFYIRTLDGLAKAGETIVSSKKLAEVMGLSDVQVRKDISNFGKVGKPRVGYKILELKKFLELTDRVFILDSDIGSDIDDAMALLLCLRLKDFPLAAITTVYNCVELRARIARKMLQLEGLNMPVGIGIGVPMDELSFTWQTDREGKGLLDESDLNASLDDLDITEDGIKLMIDTIKQYAGQVEIIAIGQFTNVATAIKRDPEIKNKIKILTRQYV